MKKIFNFLVLFIILSSMFIVTSCSTENEEGNSDHQHIFTSTVVDATEKNDGYTSHTCSECGYVYHDAFTTNNYPLHTHEYNKTIVAPTTTHQGYTKYVCSKCAYEYHDTFISVIAPTHTHKYSKTIIEPTCEKDGYTLNACGCGDEYRDSFVDAKGHDYQTLISETLNLESDLGEEQYQCINCDKTYTNSISAVNKITKGVKSFNLGQNDMYLVSAENGYSDSYFTLTVSNLDLGLSGTHLSGSLYFTFDADYGLFYHQAYRMDFDTNVNVRTYTYENGSYPIDVSYLSNFVIDKTNDKMVFKFDYSKFKLSKESADGNFAFYLVINNRYKTYEYKDKNPYVLPGYSQTWIKVNENNRFYYNTKYQELHASRLSEPWNDNTSRPDITKAETNWTHICRAETPEEAVVSTMIAEEQGATNVDVNLLYLNPIYRNVEDMKRIYHAFKNIGTISVYYNGEISQEERLDLLKKSIEAGAGGLDLQGFMYHEGSTRDTQTAENIKYWEEKGYDMSFVYASPKELVIEPSEVAKQVAYIDEIHAMGGKVLLSAHLSAELSREQLNAYAKYIDSTRGVDIIKVGAYAHNTASLEGLLLSNRDVYYNETINAKFSAHSNNSSCSDISRIVGPLFYHTYMAFNYNYLCKLQMMMELLHSGVNLSDTTSVNDAIEMLRGKTKDPEYEYYYGEYKRLSTDALYAFGEASDLSDRWSVSGDTKTIQLRNATGTNSFSLKGVAYQKEINSNSFTYETEITGKTTPYIASKRVPKFGIFIGSQDKMIAVSYVFDSSSKFSVGVYANTSYFSYDKLKSDALTVKLMDNVTVDANINNGDSIKLIVEYKNGELKVSYSVANNTPVLIKAFTYDEIKNYYTHDTSDMSTRGGNVVEVYLGSASVGFENYISFKNTVK